MTTFVAGPKWVYFDKSGQEIRDTEAMFAIKRYVDYDYPTIMRSSSWEMYRYIGGRIGWSYSEVNSIMLGAEVYGFLRRDQYITRTNRPKHQLLNRFTKGASDYIEIYKVGLK